MRLLQNIPSEKTGQGLELQHFDNCLAFERSSFLDLYSLKDQQCFLKDEVIITNLIFRVVNPAVLNTTCKVTVGCLNLTAKITATNSSHSVQYIHLLFLFFSPVFQQCKNVFKNPSAALSINVVSTPKKFKVLLRKHMHTYRHTNTKYNSRSSKCMCLCIS